MSNIALFAVGCVVTLLVAAAIALLVWGAILDGRYNHEQQAAEDDASMQSKGARALHAADAA